MRYLLCRLFLLCLLLSGCASVDKKVIPVYVYHHFPPFVIEHQTDLSELFVDHLNRNTGYHWKLVVLSRVELNQLRQKGRQGVLLWANPKWFGNSPDLIASEPVLWDADVLAYRNKNPLIGSYPKAISNKKFCANAGHRYLALEPYFATGEVSVIEQKSQDDCVHLLRSGVVDFIQVEKSNLFTQYSQLFQRELAFMEPAVDSFQRFVLVDSAYRDVLPQLNREIVRLRQDPLWKKELAAFGESRFVDLFDLDIEALLNLEVPE